WAPSRRPITPVAIVGALALAAGLAAVAIRGPAQAGPPATPTAPLRAGGIEIGTDPPGAQGWLDGVEAGQSPLNLSAVRPGRHSIRLALPGFSTAELTLDVPGGAFGVPLRFTLQPVSAVLQVHSEPEGAEVSVDGQTRGMTPLKGLSVPPG